MNAQFIDLILWVLLPLLALLSLWALLDCLRSSISGRLRLLYGLAIFFLPGFGAIYWLRSKTALRAKESSLMSRVRDRRSAERSKRRR